jgi:hypothetical protein
MAPAEPAPGEERLSSNVLEDIIKQDDVENSQNVEKSTALADVNEKPNSHAVKDDGDALQEADAVYPSIIVLQTILLGLILATFLVYLDMSIVATAIPRITDQFKSVDQVCTSFTK